MTAFRTAPDDTRTGFPAGIPFIVANEACERFSFYGMRAILFVYLVSLFRGSGLTEAQSDEEAKAVFHAFVGSAYALPMVGAAIADRWLGKYRTILVLSLVYCAGHATLAIFHGSLGGTLAGLALVALGAGGIKPCVSAHVGDQFGAANRFRLERIYQVFYFTINAGAFVASLTIPVLRERAGFGWAFAVPGILMGLATFAFHAGRNTFVHVPPTPGGRLGAMDAGISTLLVLGLLAPLFGGEFVPAYGALAPITKVALSATVLTVAFGCHAARQRRVADDGMLAITAHAIARRGDEGRPYTEDERVHGRFFAPAVRAFGASRVEGAVAAYRMLAFFGITSVFWALFDQQGSTWVAQARLLDRRVELGPLRFELLPEQITAANPILVLVFVPLAGLVVHPFVERRLGIAFGPIRRIGTGLVIAALSFVVLAWVQQRLDAGTSVSILWQFVAAAILTAAEVLVAVTGLELGYRAAPARMKSTISGYFLLAIAIGNLLVTAASHGVQVGPAGWFWGFAAAMALAALAFRLLARRLVEDAA